MSNATTSRQSDLKALRRLERADRAANDPWFGRRRKTSMEGNRKAKANKAACRGRVAF